MEEFVFLIQGPRRSARLHLRGPFFVIGRAEPFPVFHDDPTLSREHAAVVETAEGYRLKDLGSRNGVVLNGQKLGRYAEVPLRRGDTLQAGDTKIRLVSVAEFEAARAGRTEQAGLADAEFEAARLEDSEETITVDASGQTGYMAAVDLDGEDADSSLGEVDEFDGEVTLALDRPQASTPGRELALPLDDDWEEAETLAPGVRAAEVGGTAALVEAADSLLGDSARAAQAAADETEDRRAQVAAELEEEELSDAELEELLSDEVSDEELLSDEVSDEDLEDVAEEDLEDLEDLAEEDLDDLDEDLGEDDSDSAGREGDEHVLA